MTVTTFLFSLCRRFYLFWMIILMLPGCADLDFTGHEQCFHPELPTFKNVKVALVLGGGGVKGLAHLGVIEELERAGIKPDLIVGCSAGAIVGALYADSLDIKIAKKSLMEQNRSTLFDITLANLPFALSRGLALQTFLDAHLKSKDFSELKIPFVAVTTSLEFGEEVVFAQGPVIPAVRASSAFPGVFFPIKIEGHYYSDGGIVDPVPVKIARQLGAQYIIAVDLAGDLTKTAPSNLLGVAKRSLEISYRRLSILSAKKADYTIRVPLGEVGTFDDGYNQAIYQIGKSIAIHDAKEIRQALFQKGLL